MSRTQLNPECWNCGNTTGDDRICPKCGEHIDDDPEIDDMAGEREFMKAESKHRPLSEDERIIYSL